MDNSPVNILDIGKLRNSCKSCALSNLCLPAGMNAEALNLLVEVIQPRPPLARGQTLFHAGMPFRSLYVVRSGTFKTVVDSESGDGQVLGFHLASEIIGFDAFAHDVHRCTAEALEHSTVCEISYDNLQDLSNKIPELNHQLLRTASREVVKDHEHLVMMGRRPAQERLAVFLRGLSDRHRRLRHRHDAFVLSMSRQEIANYLGLVIETVSRLFTRFEELGVLMVERKQIRILDFVKLDKLTGDLSPALLSAAS